VVPVKLLRVSIHPIFPIFEYNEMDFPLQQQIKLTDSLPKGIDLQEFGSFF
jgi:hypothetical protein